MKRLWRFVKRNGKVLGCFLILFLVLCVLYIKCAKCKLVITGLANILAIPSIYLAIIVLDSLKISPENLDAYYKKRKLKENEYKLKEDDAKKEFDEFLGNIGASIGEYYKFTMRVNSGDTTNANMKNFCKREIDKVKAFFDKTKSFIILYIEKNYGESGEVDRIDYIDVKNIIMDNKEVEYLNETLNKLNSQYFEDDIDKEKMGVLNYLFLDENRGYRKYINLCKQIYSIIGGNNNE